MDSQPSSEQPSGSLFRRLSNRLKGKAKDPSTPGRADDDKIDSDRDSGHKNKNWAQSYINGPLTAIEPSQETGPGSSFINPHRSSSVKDKGKQVPRNNYPTPPTSGTSSSGNNFHPSNPFSNDQYPNSPISPATEDELDQLKLLKLLELDQSPPRRSGTVKSRRQAPVLPDLDLGPRAGIPRSQSVEKSPPKGVKVSRSKTTRDNKYPPITRRPVGLGQSRSQSVTSGKPGLSRSQSVDSASAGLRRSGSLSQRYPGDMSVRPLEQIKRETRAADRAPHLRKKNMPRADIIDKLDDIAGTYHHDGPYDATLAARNKNKMYSPVEATKYSNMEALKATPYDNVQDSLRKHVPLHGTANIPPGMTDMSGRRMSYEEGVDLMREPSAPGGAYRRYDDIPYHPDDLKGKGEPSFTIERSHKDQKRRAREPSGHNGYDGTTYEMQPTRPSLKDGNVTVRQRSYSSSSHGTGPAGSPAPGATTTSSGVRRSSTTGKRIGEGLKRRFGSLRRKEPDT